MQDVWQELPHMKEKHIWQKLFGAHFQLFSSLHVPSAHMEEAGLVNYSAASHQKGDPEVLASLLWSRRVVHVYMQSGIWNGDDMWKIDVVAGK